MKQGEYPKIDK